MIPGQSPGLEADARPARWRARERLRGLLPWVGTLLAVGALWTALFNVYQSEINQERATQVTDAERLVRAFEESTRALLRYADNVLLSIRAMQQTGASPQDIGRFLTQIHPDPLALKSFALFDAAGDLVYSSAPGEVGALNVADRSFFTSQRATDTDQLAIGLPISGGIAKPALLPLSRRLTDSEARFRGVIVAFLDPARITDLYKELHLGPRSNMSLIGLDRLVRARYPESLAADQAPDATGSALWPAFERSPAGAYRQRSVLDDVPRAYVYRKLTAYPLILTIGVAEADVVAKLEGLADQIILFGAGLSLAAIVIGGLVASLIGTSARLTAANRASGELSSYLGRIMDLSDVGIIHVRDGKIVRRNPRFAELLGLRGRVAGAELELATIEPLVAAAAAAAPVLDRGLTYRGDFRLRHDDGSEPMLSVAASPVVAGDPSHGAIWVLTDITERWQLEEDLKRQAMTDVLTGIGNRRFLIERAERELLRARRYGRPLAVLLIDVDHFKQVNDRHGHAVGDQVLQALADVCRTTLRAIDLLGRLGGEEFGIVLPETDRQAALEVAERLRQRIMARTVPLGDGTSVTVTVSIGISMLAPDDGSIEPPLSRADKALYRAKAAGRNRTETEASV